MWLGWVVGYGAALFALSTVCVVAYHSKRLWFGPVGIIALVVMVVFLPSPVRLVNENAQGVPALAVAAASIGCLILVFGLVSWLERRGVMKEWARRI